MGAMKGIPTIQGGSRWRQEETCNGTMKMPPPDFRPTLSCPFAQDKKFNCTETFKYFNDIPNHCFEAHGAYARSLLAKPAAQYWAQWKTFQKKKKKSKIPARPVAKCNA